MDINWINSLAASLLGSLIGFGVWYFQSRIDALRREQERLHDDRRKVYSDVLEPFVLLFAGMKDPKENAKALQHMLSAEYKRTAFQFSLIGADNVVRAFNDLMQYVYSFDPQTNMSPDPGQVMSLYGAFLLEIRKNVGNPKTELALADMLRGQVKDVEKLIGPSS